MNAIKAILDTSAGVQETFKGIPVKISAQVSASVSVGDRAPEDKMAGYHETTVGFFVEFAYQTGYDGGAAEDALADWLDAFEELWLADRSLGGICRTSRLDFSLIREPAYRPTAGAPYRIYPLVVEATIPR